MAGLVPANEVRRQPLNQILTEFWALTGSRLYRTMDAGSTVCTSDLLFGNAVPEGNRFSAGPKWSRIVTPGESRGPEDSEETGYLPTRD